MFEFLPQTIRKLNFFLDVLLAKITFYSPLSSDEMDDFPQILEWLVWFLQQQNDFGSDNELDNLENFPELR